MTSLEEILAPERMDAARDQHRRTRDLLLDRGCLLFGPGTNGRQAAEALRSASAPVAHAFISDVAADIGRTVCGLPVLSRDQALARHGAEVPVVNCVYRADVTLAKVTAGLRESGFRQVYSLPHLSAAFADSLPNIYGFGGLEVIEADAARITEAHGLLADQESRRRFAELVAQRIALDFSAERSFDRAIYFPDFLTRRDLAPDGAPFVFVDCGAYTGDTLETLPSWARGQDAQAVAFEPDPASFARLEAVGAGLAGLEVHCILAAAGASNGSIGFASLGNEASRVVPGEGDTPLVTVDSALQGLGLRASYIKYDVEGFERDAIAGSASAIADDAAGLAVSIYHRPDDLWDLLLKLRDMQPRYRFHLREHGPDGVDTVLYALANG